MTKDQILLMEPILNTIENEDIRDFAKVLLEDLPPYIWEVPASSTGKYHPSYSLGMGGLMRHSIAVVKFLNYLFTIGSVGWEITDKEKDLLRVAGLVHDGRKSGKQEEYEKSKYTKFEHPFIMAEAIRSYKGKYLDPESIELIAHSIESHMGQWNTDKKNNIVLPIPDDKYRYLIHTADYLASRKDIILIFDDNTIQFSTPNILQNVEDMKEYIITFGKHKNEKLGSVWSYDRDWLLWCKENTEREPLITYIKKLEEDSNNALKSKFVADNSVPIKKKVEEVEKTEKVEELEEINFEDLFEY